MVDRLGPDQKRRAFVRHWLTNGYNGGKAYKDAGYVARTPNSSYVGASILLRHPKVMDYIAEITEDLGLGSKLTPEFVRTGFVKLLDKAVAKGDLSTAARILGDMARVLAMFKDVQRIEDTRSEDLLGQVRGLLPDDKLEELARLQGIDPKDIN